MLQRRRESESKVVSDEVQDSRGVVHFGVHLFTVEERVLNESVKSVILERAEISVEHLCWL